MKDDMTGLATYHALETQGFQIGDTSEDPTDKEYTTDLRRYAETSVSQAYAASSLGLARILGWELFSQLIPSSAYGAVLKRRLAYVEDEEFSYESSMNALTHTSWRNS